MRISLVKVTLALMLIPLCFAVQEASAAPNVMVKAKNAAIKKVFKGCDKKLLPGFCKAGRIYVAYKAGQKALSAAEIAEKARLLKATKRAKRVKKVKRVATVLWRVSPQRRGVKTVGYAGKLLKKVKQGYDKAKDKR